MVTEGGSMEFGQWVGEQVWSDCYCLLSEVRGRAILEKEYEIVVFFKNLFILIFLKNIMFTGL